MIDSSVDYKYLPRPTWAEIDIDAILNNINEYKKALGDKVEIIVAASISSIDIIVPKDDGAASLKLFPARNNSLPMSEVFALTQHTSETALNPLSIEIPRSPSPVC